MSIVVITGASGFVGRHLIERLGKIDEMQIRAMVNRSRVSLRNRADTVVTRSGDLMRPETLKGIFERGCTVVNLAYLASRSQDENMTAMANLAAACAKAGIKRLLHCSTATVVGKVPHRVITEEIDCVPSSDYEVTKLSIERLLLEKARDNFELVTLRPTAILGPGGKNLLKLASDLKHGSSAVNYVRSCLYGRRRMNLVCIDNVTAAIEFLIDAGRCFAGDVFIVSDDDAPENNFQDVERFLMEALGIRGYLLPRFSAPSFVLSALLRTSRCSNSDPARVYDSSRLVDAGYRKDVSFVTGLRVFTDWYRKASQSPQANTP